VLPIVHGKLRANGINLHYIEQGNGPPILFLHGFPEFSGAWNGIMAHLSPRFRTIAVDTRGINLSDRPAGIEAYRLQELVEDVCQAVVALGYQKLTLVGHDWGGFIAWEVAIRRPEVLERVVVVNAAHNGIFDQLVRAGGAQAQASKYMLAFRSPRGEELVSRNDFAVFRNEILEPALASETLTQAQASDYLAIWRTRESLEAGLNYYRANKSGPPSGDDCEPRRLEETIVRVPTLVIWGEKDDYFTLENLSMLPSVVPNLAIRRFPENSHWIVHQRPADVAALIANFVDGTLRAGR
jgi:pimeloyl-ACP methyl ester carboxylesterase